MVLSPLFLFRLMSTTTVIKSAAKPTAATTYNHHKSVSKMRRCLARVFLFCSTCWIFECALLYFNQTISFCKKMQPLNIMNTRSWSRIHTSVSDRQTERQTYKEVDEGYHVLALSPCFQILLNTNKFSL